ncbi:MAG: hypothetical protein FJ109_05325 [Deltaproteobacteria bacterium]|nr:hypothetical protein [Deltaproteobacteria bacterium]
MSDWRLEMKTGTLRIMALLLLLSGASGCTSSDGGATDTAGGEAPCCVPQCEGKECGDDGCGGECGDCGKNQVCAPTGQCECQFHQCGETCCDKDYTSCDDGGCCDPYCGNDCSDTSCLGCLPSCEGDECGDDGCGGTCGLCEEGLECLITKFGRRCTTTCEPFSCPEGQLCLFGVCVDQECKTDDDCGGAPEHYCDTFLQCRKRTSCKTWADCMTWNKPHYCDLDVGFCMEDGNCWEDSDCPGGTCGADHWCFGHNCSLPDAPGCPPYLPACDMPEGDMPLCDGQTCGTCIAPCVFDSDCPPGKECQGNWCNAPGNDCILDSECAQGQHCHPGCAALEPTCQTEADCADASGKLCIAGFCGGPNEVLTCKDDAPCLAWREGYTCQGGVCKPEGACVLDSQCKPGEYCGQVCLPAPELPECKTDAGCPAGQICENQDCQVPPECNFHSQCPTGHVCKGQHCYNDQGVCAWMEKGPEFCDDGDPCTVDSCDAQTGCVHVSGGCQ